LLNVRLRHQQERDRVVVIEDVVAGDGVRREGERRAA
jgi:hypothetical protein